jgi:predicted esterase
MTEMTDPHAGQPVLTAGVPLSTASRAAVMVHGRGASAAGILRLGAALDVEDAAFLAPQAAGNTWYPHSFMSPLEWNEPGIASAMGAITRVVEQVNAAGIPTERILLLGFSQGACLVTEYAARHATRYLGIAGLSGGLIGPDGTPRDYPGSLEGTPVFLGCSDVDGHIPASRVRETADVLQALGGEVTMRLYPGMGHDINGDELTAVRDILVNGRIPPADLPG